MLNITTATVNKRTPTTVIIIYLNCNIYPLKHDKSEIITEIN